MLQLQVKGIIIGGCLIAIFLLYTATQIWNYPFPSTWKEAQIESTATAQPQTTTAVPIPSRPVLVTGFSSNHFSEAQAMFHSLHTYLPGYKIVAYDLGLTEAEREKTRKHCQCDVRSLIWDRYPEHVRTLGTYAFKPMIVNETVREFGFIFWMDASVRIISSNIEPLWNFTISVGFAAAQDGHIVNCLTHPATFTALNVSQPELYQRARTIQATYLLFTNRSDIIENILVPWVQCASNKECIAPTGATVGGCTFEKSPSYCNCHRFDQTALEIILYRYFPGQFEYNPKIGKTPFAQFSIGTWLNLFPQYNILVVNRGEGKDYFPN